METYIIGFFVFMGIFGIISSFSSHIRIKNLVSGEKLKKEMTVDERIDEVITILSAKGFLIQSRNGRQLQLFRRKQFNFIVGLICLLLAVLPLIIYIIFYLSQKDMVKIYSFKDLSSAETN